jgi:hypothetical protein
VTGSGAPPTTAFEPPAGESLGLLALPAGSAPGSLRSQRLEFSCRGDRARLDVLLPDGTGPFPTLLLQPAPSDGPAPRELPGLPAWISAGAAVATVTLPLFGSRRSPKLTAKLEAAVQAADAGRTIDETDRILWSEFTRQSVLELRVAIDALGEAWGAEVPSVAYAGAGIGASLGAVLCAVDSRPVAALLAGMGSAGPDGIAPVRYLDDLAPDRVEVHESEGVDLADTAWTCLAQRLGVA